MTVLDKNNHIPGISFARFAAANLDYGAFGELVESSSLSGLISRSIAITHYGQYDDLVEGPNLVVTLKDEKKDSINAD